MTIPNSYPVRQLRKNEPIPFDLLLLADEEMQAINRYIDRSEIYVVETDLKIIGVYAFFPIDEHTAEIKAIAVDVDYQNRGIGKHMLEDAANRAREKGFRELLIGTPTIAGKQLEIYQKAGFRLFDVKANFFLTHYSKPIFENGVQLRDMAMLKKIL
jgi:aminoglycoside 6'-N-acetyltransferase I